MSNETLTLNENINGTVTQNETINGTVTQNETINGTVNQNETINGTVNVNQDSSSKFELVQPFKVENDSNSTLEIKPLSQTSSETVDIKPVRVDNRQEVAYTDPIRTDSNSTVDLKPVALDMCVRTGHAPLPPTHVCEPYRHKIAITLMGVEMYGLILSGESQTIIDDRPGRQVIGGEVLGRAPEHHARPHHQDEGGMRIRLT